VTLERERDWTKL